MNFCNPICIYLSPTEKEQEDLTKTGNFVYDHKCKKYHKIIRHQTYHPNLVRLNECDYIEEGE